MRAAPRSCTATVDAAADTLRAARDVRNYEVDTQHDQELRDYEGAHRATAVLGVTDAWERYSASPGPKAGFALNEALIQYSRHVNAYEQKLANLRSLRSAFVEVLDRYVAGQEEINQSLTTGSFANLRAWVEANAKRYADDVAALRKIHKSIFATERK